MNKEKLKKPNVMDIFYTLEEVSEIIGVDLIKLKHLMISEGFVEKNSNGNFVASKDYKTQVKRKMKKVDNSWKFSHFEISSTLKEYFTFII